MALAPARSNSFESIPLESGPGTSGQSRLRSPSHAPHYRVGLKVCPGPNGPLVYWFLPSPLGGRQDERRTSQSPQEKAILSLYVLISCAAVFWFFCFGFFFFCFCFCVCFGVCFF